MNDEPLNTEHPLVAWVNQRVDDWVDYRDNNYKDKWAEYYRLWRGVWLAEDKGRQSERSRLIAPALQQAIESTTAELEEAIFGKGRWFDISDDVMDQNPQDIQPFRDKLYEDMDESGIPPAVSEILLNACLYGTGVGKVVVEEEVEYSVTSQQDRYLPTREAGVETAERVKVGLYAVSPFEFSIDPAAKSVKDALGCAQDMVVTRHSVVQKMSDGVYQEKDIGSYSDDEDVYMFGEHKTYNCDDKVKIREYYGLVPVSMLDPELEDGEELVDIEFDDDGEESQIYGEEDEDLVEAIVTIANDGVLLRAVRNPYITKDRPFIAFALDTVPNRFWGRGIAEKGYNSQKALDAELRARIDAMALSIHPMVAVDGTRLPRGGNFTIQPGKTVITNGNPREALMPFNFGQVNPQTFSQTGELERMIQMGTGAMDSATPVSIAPRNNTASGMSMISAGAVKRSKRYLVNIERNFLKPLVHKVAWRYMQFDPERYPPSDVKFKVQGSLGIMAREFEQQQYVNLLQSAQPGSPEYYMLMMGVYENSSLSNREQMVGLLQGLLQRAMNPPPPQPDPALELAKQQLQIEAQNNSAKLQIDAARVQNESRRIMIEAAKADSSETRMMADAIKSLAQAEAAEVGTQLDEYRAIVDTLKAKSTQEAENATRREDLRNAPRPVPIPRMGVGQAGSAGNVQQPPGAGPSGMSGQRPVAVP